MQLVYTLLFVNFCDVQVSDSPDETTKANAKITNVKQSLAMREIERFKEALMECGKLLWKNINIYIYIEYYSHRLPMISLYLESVLATIPCRI